MSFYENAVLNDNFDFTSANQPGSIRGDIGQKTVTARLTSVTTLFVMSAMLTFGPCAIATPAPLPDIADKRDAPIVVRVVFKGIPNGRFVEKVPVPEIHRRATERFKVLFRYIPQNDAEKLPDPDYGL